MSLDKDKLSQLFSQGAGEGAAQKNTEEKPALPVLKEVWETFADKFAAEFDVHREMRQDGSRYKIWIACKKDNPDVNSLQISANDNGTFCINHSGFQTYNERSLEDTVIAIGRFYGRHSGPPAAAEPGVDKSALGKLFEQGAETGRAQKQEAEDAQKPSLKNIWALVADKFAADPTFEVHADRPGELWLANKQDGHSLQVSDNKDGTFCINSDGHETYNKTPPEQTIAAIGRYYGRYAK